METSTYPHTYPKTRRFLIMEGGPFYRIERRVGLIRENPPRTIRSAVLAACLTWLVLLILSALNGAAAGEGVELPFLHDFSAYGRFLLPSRCCSWPSESSGRESLIQRSAFCSRTSSLKPTSTGSMQPSNEASSAAIP